MQSQQTPSEYPIQEVAFMPSSRVLEPEHGVQKLWPWPEREILANSNKVVGR